MQMGNERTHSARSSLADPGNRRRSSVVQRPLLVIPQPLPRVGSKA